MRPPPYFVVEVLFFLLPLVESVLLFESEPVESDELLEELVLSALASRL